MYKSAEKSTSQCCPQILTSSAAYCARSMMHGAVLCCCLQGLPLLSVPAEFDETGCISHHGGGGGDSGGAAAVRHTPSSFTAASAGGTSFTSFTWPPGRSDPSEGLLPQALPQGPFTSINPLANAIDVKAAAAAATAGSTAVKVGHRQTCTQNLYVM